MPYNPDRNFPVYIVAISKLVNVFQQFHIYNEKLQVEALKRKVLRGDEKQ